MQRKASAVWQGGLKDGKGSITTDSGVLKQTQYSFGTRFENGVGTFYSDSTTNGKTVRTRFTWSQITPTSARWEQATSDDAGKTWDTNWIMEFRRKP